MGRKKKESQVLTSAETRLAGIKSIDENLDLGGGVSVAAYQEEIGKLKGKLEEYNTTLSKTDELLNQTKALEKAVGSLSTRMLSGVAPRFGKDSDEYEKAGGVRTSERKKPKRKGGEPKKYPPGALHQPPCFHPPARGTIPRARRPRGRNLQARACPLPSSHEQGAVV